MGARGRPRERRADGPLRSDDQERKCPRPANSQVRGLRRWAILGSNTKVSRELVEDTDIEDALTNAIAASFALELDRAALYGTGASNQPTGIKANSGVAETPLGANGATPSYDAMVDSVGRLRDLNGNPTAQVMADRAARTLAKIKDTAGNYLTSPTYLDDVPRLSTSHVPINLTVGTSSDTSDVFTADWRQLLIGVRIDLTISLLEERYMADNGQYGFVAWWRGDVQVPGRRRSTWSPASAPDLGPQRVRSWVVAHRWVRAPRY